MNGTQYAVQNLSAGTGISIANNVISNTNSSPISIFTQSSLSVDTATEFISGTLLANKKIIDALAYDDNGGGEMYKLQGIKYGTTSPAMWFNRLTGSYAYATIVTSTLSGYRKVQSMSGFSSSKIKIVIIYSN